jgi:hypothetical protein
MLKNLLVLCFLFSILSGLVFALDNVSEQKLVASDRGSGDRFGASVSFDEDYAVIGAFLDDDKGSQAGAAYIFWNNGTNWVEEQKLTASDGAANDRMGYSVSIDGSSVITGAYYDDENGVEDSGSAYIFKYNGTDWVEQAELVASDGAAGDEFGYSVSISGNYALIGAHFDDDNGNDSGSAYIFKYNGTDWVEQQKLISSDGALGDWFGYSVSISGDYALVGVRYDDDKGSQSGSAYIFWNNGTAWVEKEKLTAADGTFGDEFGWSVFINGNHAIVGAHYDGDNGYRSGSAYVFKFNGTNWVEQDKLLASDGVANDKFGDAVSIDTNGNAVVGAYADESYKGAAYLFKPDGNDWVEWYKLVASDGVADDHFANSAVSIDEDYCFVGAYNEDYKGAVYVFEYNNSAPNITITQPDGINDTADDSYTIEWNDSDSDDDASISLYYDNDDSGEDGTLIVSGISEDNETDVYVWNTSNIPNGNYYIYAVIDDGVNTPVVDYSDGAISIVNITNETFKLSIGISGANPVSLDGNYAIIGTPNYINGRGAAHIYEFNGTDWEKQTTLMASDYANDDHFGISVDIDGDYAVIGAYGVDYEIPRSPGTEVGAAYVFKFNGTNWTEVAKLSASDKQADAWFGISVSIDGDYMVIGAGLDDGNGNNAGAAYVFKLTGGSWVQMTKLAAGGATYDNFGLSVSISGNYTIIGAHRNNYDAGAAYIYEFNGTNWLYKQKLVSSDWAFGDHFGSSVSIKGNSAIVGAFWDIDNGYKSGSAYIYEFNGTSWVETDKLLASDGGVGDYFGGSVSIGNDYAVVGSYFDDHSQGIDSGSAYVYKLNEAGWTEMTKLLASNGAVGNNFGNRVFIDEDRVIIGSKSSYDYIYELN